MVSSINKLSRNDRAAAGATTLLSFLVYGYTAAPSVSVEDTGELIAAAYVLGIPHPTGYPLWTLLAHLWGFMVPFGEYAWRINLFSGFWAALTLYFVVLTGIRLTGSRWASVAAALMLGFSFEFWEQSVIAEVYTLNAFFFAVCIYILLVWSESRESRHLVWFTLVYGLSLTNHSTMFLVGPIFAGFILWHEPALMKSGKRLAGLLGVLLATQLVWLYLPIRSFADPAMDWGNPETASNFWKVITRHQYQTIISGEERTLSRFGAQLAVFAKTYAEQFNVLWILLPIIGFAIAIYKNRSAGAMLAALFLVVALGAILIPNFNLEYQDIWLNTTYWIPCYLAAAIAAVYALDFFFKFTKYIAVPILAILTTFPVTDNFRHNDMRGYVHSRQYATALFESMESNAIYIGGADHAVFPLVYLQIVEGMRPDVTIMNPYGYPNSEVIATLPDGKKSDLATPPVYGRDTERVLDHVMTHENRPIYSSARLGSRGREIVNEGLLYRYYRVGEERSTGEREAQLLENLDDSLSGVNHNKDWTAFLIEYEIEKSKLEKEISSDEFESDEFERERWMMISLFGLPRDKRVSTNLGQVFARHGEYSLAQTYLSHALEIDPGYTPAVLNLARVYVESDRYEEAVELLEKKLASEPDEEVRAYLKKIQRTP
jgi:tetratricopeptide (TPR) repeat protein